MELSQKEAQKIAEDYRLGNVKKVLSFSEGWVNWNYKLETDLGDYVVQILGGKYNEFKKNKMKVEIKVLEYLSKKGFPYSIPIPVKNKKGDYVSKIRKRRYWVYNYVKGKINNRSLTTKEFKEMARVLAIFHKYMIASKLKKTGSDINDFYWYINRYKKLRKIKPKNKIDRLFLKHCEEYIDLLEKLKKIDYGEMIINHTDFHEMNLLFEKDKIVGIIDFDGLKTAPKIFDIALAIMGTDYLPLGWNKQKEKIFLKEYEKILPVSEKERKLILPILIRHQCVLFWWFYDSMEKNQDKIYSSMLDSVRKIENLLMEWKKQK